MFNVRYDIVTKSTEKVLYSPDIVHKIYNCLELSEDIEMDLQQHFYINGFEQVVVHKEKNLIYFAPGLDNLSILEKNNSILLLNNEKYNISCEPISKIRLIVGSLILSNFNHRHIYRKNDQIVVYCNNKPYSTQILLPLIKYGLYLHNQPNIILHYLFNSSLLNAINKSNKIYIQSISNPKKDIDIELRLNINGGSPFINTDKYNRIPKYHCKILENEDVIFDDFINNYYIFKLKNNSYTIFIRDSNDNTPIVNNIANNDNKIIINLQNKIFSQDPYQHNQSPKIVPPLSEAFNIFLESKKQ